MACLNRVQIIGNLGADPELKYTQNQTPVCSFSVACTDKWTDKQSGEAKEKTEWIRIVAWNKLAENCSKYLAKGRQVFVEGKFTTRQWEDKDGQKRWTTEVVAQDVQFLGSKPADGEQRQQPAAQKPAAQKQQEPQGNFGGPETPGLDDIPF